MNMALSRRAVLVLAAAILPLRAKAEDGGGAEICKPIIELYAALESLMRMGRTTPFPERFKNLAPAIDRAYDLNTVLRVSVGLRWPSFSNGARAELAEVFRAFTIASFVANFDKFDGERFEILPETRVVGADQVVQTRIIPENGDTIRLDYVMQPSESGWRITDVLLDGTISRVAVQRSDFRALLAGGDSVPLINSLRRKIAFLSGGSIIS